VRSTAYLRKASINLIEPMEGLRNDRSLCRFKTSSSDHDVRNPSAASDEFGDKISGHQKETAYEPHTWMSA
jgi:hypothetical protein